MHGTSYYHAVIKQASLKNSPYGKRIFQLAVSAGEYFRSFGWSRIVLINLKTGHAPACPAGPQPVVRIRRFIRWEKCPFEAIN
jgi:hypothetical protein